MTAKPQKPFLFGVLLPVEIEQLIYEFDPTFRIVFNCTIQAMNRLVKRPPDCVWCDKHYTGQELKFKNKYRRFYGDGTYAIVHNNERVQSPSDCYIRISSVRPQCEFDGMYNSIFLQSFKILLMMKESRNPRYNDLDFKLFYTCQNQTRMMVNRIYSESSDEEEDEEEEDGDFSSEILSESSTNKDDEYHTEEPKTKKHKATTPDFFLRKSAEMMFNDVIHQIDRLLAVPPPFSEYSPRHVTFQPELHFKKKFRQMYGHENFNRSYRITHDKYRPCGYFRIAGVDANYDSGFGTLLLKASDILLTMEETGPSYGFRDLKLFYCCQTQMMARVENFYRHYDWSETEESSSEGTGDDEEE
jgi:hypothetical protein